VAEQLSARPAVGGHGPPADDVDLGALAVQLRLGDVARISGSAASVKRLEKLASGPTRS
jgi:hypothetical protein